MSFLMENFRCILFKIRNLIFIKFLLSLLQYDMVGTEGFGQMR